MSSSSQAPKESSSPLRLIVLRELAELELQQTQQGNLSLDTDVLKEKISTLNLEIARNQNPLYTSFGTKIKMGFQMVLGGAMQEIAKTMSPNDKASVNFFVQMTMNNIENFVNNNRLATSKSTIDQKDAEVIKPYFYTMRTKVLDDNQQEIQRRLSEQKTEDDQTQNQQNAQIQTTPVRPVIKSPLVLSPRGKQLSDNVFNPNLRSPSRSSSSLFSSPRTNNTELPLVTTEKKTTQGPGNNQ